MKLRVACLFLTMAIAGCGERAPDAELAAIERAGRMNDQALRAILDQQVANGEKTPEEAACNYRLGLWDIDQEICFDADDPAIRRPSSKSVPVRDADAACAAATARVTAERGLPTDHVALCDPIGEADAPAGYYVLALLAYCREEVCGSTSMGWFAVQKATGDVFEWDVSESRPGRVVGGG